MMMGWVVVAILLFVILAFGFTSGAQSYATAQQAQAQIEVAQVAQINAWGNLVTILIVGLIILLALVLIAAIAWLMMRRAMSGADKPSARGGSKAITTSQAPVLDNAQLGLLVQLKILELLNGQSPRQLPPPVEEQPAEEPLSWLRLE
jgi:hypothetical protein